ncbi:WavE lipopolysaccharide synthesis family protein [Alcanivorax sp. JB21]|uniref:WavE lipopolysaccharide synthesis family protein n=1 Tax=Alcanivorax limicola TaxID=2874102 RepID=UPI001CC0F628|nr:WavE lipopolysaccharide synthesis family protein [Alcanivorax limicola]MBZ2190302.1 WavE lipopolysaccharide synthesis family protein [Alcanivorax limicola]
MRETEQVSISNAEISFVVHGPVQSMPDRPQDDGITARSIASIREYFPGSPIICSTWRGQPVEGLGADVNVLSDDPGPTVCAFDRYDEPIIRNLDRQAVSVRNGLARVNTRYAVKLRSDNILNSSSLVQVYQKYLRPEVRHDKYAILNQRVLITNYWASEYLRGLKVPFFFCDFIHFGLADDLAHLWDLPPFDDYGWDPALSGTRQHLRYPWPQRCVEQIIYSRLASRAGLCDEIAHKYDQGENVGMTNQKVSDAVLVDNFIVADPDMLSLYVPERLRHKKNYKYYTFKRWEHLFASHHDGFDFDRVYAARRSIIRFFSFIKTGIRTRLRLLFRKARWEIRHRHGRYKGDAGNLH